MKKILAALLAIMMVAALGITAFAANGTSLTFNVPLTKIVEKDADASFPNETYTFTITPGAAGSFVSSDGTQEIKAGVSGTAANNTITFSSADTEAEKEATATYTATFTSTGVYHYVVSEVPGSTAGEVYSNATYDVYVQVVNNGTGGLQIGGVVIYAGGTDVTNLLGSGDAADSKVPPEWTNTIAGTSLSVKKVVTGNMAEMDRKFAISITVDGVGTGSYVTTINGVASEKKTYTLGTALNVELGHNDTVLISGLPIGATYTVVETDAATGYTKTYSGDCDENGAGTLGTGVSNVTVTNDRDVTLTGVFANFAPYVIALSVALAAGVVLFVAKKRKVSEN